MRSNLWEQMDAIFDLGMCYKDGYSVQKDLAEAAKSRSYIFLASILAPPARTCTIVITCSDRNHAEQLD